jgi:hypothetical protein
VKGKTYKKGRLSIIFKVLRYANIFWLIFSAIMVECTLNFNNVMNVLGGDHDGGLQLPSQLLPFLVGFFSFIRICYQLFKRRQMGLRTALDVPAGMPREEAEEPPMNSSAASSEPPHGPADRTSSWGDERQRKWPLVIRYLVAWLPWLGLVMNSPSKSRISTIIREGTGLSKYSQSDKVNETTSARRMA